MIKILPPHEAQKIAAGEVIERPSHILKELLENSIDAGATQITVWVEKAGKELIRVVDNGCGMSEADAKLCFAPHATSKVRSLDDVLTISSYGFRGEALASISAVSKVMLKTRQSSAENGLGTTLEFFDGGVQSESPVSCPVGTDFSIKSLFYNIPVRKKFLKADSTEWNQLYAIIQAFCLLHLPVHFKVYHDGKMVLNAPPAASTKDRVTQVWDHQLSSHFLELKNNSSLKPAGWLKISGFVSDHHYWRHGRQQIFMFVNKRWIKNQDLSKAILKGYSGVLPPAKFPAAIIFIDVNQDLVDINVHPKKEEVRFVKPAVVGTHLTEQIKATLESMVSDRFAAHQAPVQNYAQSFQPKQVAVDQDKQQIVQSATPHTSSSSRGFGSPLFQQKDDVDWDAILEIMPQPESEIKSESKKGFEQISVAAEQVAVQQAVLPEARELSEQGVIVGQLFKTYILVDRGHELVIVDQHAAHERVLYEKFLENFEKKEGTTLMFPERVKLSEHQLELLNRVQDFLSDQGILYERFGPDEIILKTSPPNIGQHDLKDLLQEIIQFVEEHESFDEAVFRKKLNEFTHSHMACKAAVRAGNELGRVTMQKLLDDLSQTSNRFICVHGRPTMWIIPKFDLEKKFRRR